MQPSYSISLILPAYNEVKRIAQTIAEAKAYFEKRHLVWEIIVSADGDDGTRELVAKMAEQDTALRVIGSVERRGKGYGIRKAVALAKYEIIGFTDADNKTPITELDRILPWFAQGFDLVIGSRAVAEARIEKRQPLHRRIGSIGFGVFMRNITGIKGIEDTQCGFKFFKSDVAQALFQKQRIDGYMFDVEILYLAQRANYRVKQVGVEWRDDADSRLELVRGNIRNVLDVLKIRFGRQTNIPAQNAQEAETGVSSGR